MIDKIKKLINNFAENNGGWWLAFIVLGCVWVLIANG